MFLGQIEGLFVDDDPAQGIIEGRSFIHPDLRMQFIVPVYRPSILSGPPGPHLAFGGSSESQSAIVRTGGVGTSVAFRGAFPNPFSDETALRFALVKEGHVSLKLYNVAGQLVATLADRTMSAGEQSVSLKAGTLPPGMYFATLRTDNEGMTKSVVLLP